MSLENIISFKYGSHQQLVSELICHFNNFDDGFEMVDAIPKEKDRDGYDFEILYRYHGELFKSKGMMAQKDIRYVVVDFNTQISVFNSWS